MPQAFVMPNRTAAPEEALPLLLEDNAPASAAGIRRQLLDDFDDCGIARNASSLTWEQFSAHLSKSHLGHSHEAWYRIFLACAEHNSAVEPHALIDCYCSRVDSLRQTIRAKKNELARLERLISEATTNVRKLEAEERSGILSHETQESTLIVQVVAVRNLQNETSSQAAGGFYRLHLSCNGLVGSTTPIAAGGDLFWNSMFSFERLPKEASLRVTLIRTEEWNSDSNAEEVSDCEVLLDELADQRRHDITRDMWGRVNCQLQINCQWLFSRLMLQRSFIREFTAKREVALRELETAAGQESAMVAPFGLMRGKTGVRGVLAGIRDGPQLFSATIDKVLDNMRLSSSQRALQTASIILTALATFSSYSRASFVDLCISCVALWNSMDCFHRWTQSGYVKMIVACAASMGLDVLWIRTVFSKSAENGLAKPEMGLRTATKLSSLLSFVWKIVFVVALWKCAYDQRQKRGFTTGAHR